MSVELWEACAFCGQPLRLVAGFCASCQAPVAVAQRAKLVAEVRQRAGITRPAKERPAPIRHITAPGPVPGLPRPAPALTRILLGCSCVTLCLTLVFISMRVNANPLRILFRPPDGTLTLSLTPTGAAVTQVTAGKPFYLRYGVTVQNDGAEIALTIAPEHAPAATLTERWRRGATHRSQPLVALAPDLWQFTLHEDGRILQSTSILVLGSTSMIKESPASAMAYSATTAAMAWADADLTASKT